MSGQKDTTGHLLSLRDYIPYDWFSFVCDRTLAAGRCRWTQQSHYSCRMPSTA